LGFSKKPKPEGGVALDIVLYCQTQGRARFTCAQAGCQDCIAALLREHAGLISFVILKQRIGNAEGVDLTQVGRIALWYAIEHYDLDRGVSFSTFAYLTIQHRVWHEIARASKLVGWLEAPPHQDQFEELNAAWQRSQLRGILEEGLAQLTERQRLVVEAYYGWDGEPQTLQEIGDALHLSKRRIGQIRDEALILLRLPGFSIYLRSLYERHNRQDYRKTLDRGWKWQRRYRGRE
jgi:RNA polymerase sigma factor (sigma-70 family)